MRFVLLFLTLFSAGHLSRLSAADKVWQRPNILVAISDDQSYPHASAYGEPAIKTPGFDRVARSGILFHNAFTPAPGCSPMRAAFLCGREIWQLREAGTHASYFPKDLPVYPRQLENNGYHVGMTGKGWGPGKHLGWPHNPAGRNYSQRKMKTPAGISSNDYARNFEDFLDECPDGKPFCFWFGGHEPHRVFEKGLGKKSGIDLNQVRVPSFLPDTEEVKSDLADYFAEIQWFDSHLQRMLDHLEKQGELENTLVVVTSDNGMSFPRAKANLYEYGIHMPLAIAWPTQIKSGQNVDDLVSLIDVTKMILSAAKVDPLQAEQMPGRDLLKASISGSEDAPVKRSYVYSGRERHSSSRFHSLGYPCRSIRSDSHLYIRNFRSERWPAGTPRKFDKVKFDADGKLVSSQIGNDHGGYHDIDACPTLNWMIANRNDPVIKFYLDASVQKRPAEELYDIVADPGCMKNLIDDPKHADARKTLAKQLFIYLARTGDLRVTDPKGSDAWETYPRVSGLRWFETPQWAIDDPDLVPIQPWLEERRPK